MTRSTPETSGRRVVAVIFLTMLGVFTLIGASLMLQTPSGDIDPRFLREGRFHGAWEHAGDPRLLEEWNIDWTDVVFLVDGFDAQAPNGAFTSGEPLQQPVTGFMLLGDRRVPFELDTESDEAGGTLFFDEPGHGIDAPGVLEDSILIDLEVNSERADDNLYLGFGRGKNSRVVKMLTFRRVP